VVIFILKLCDKAVRDCHVRSLEGVTTFTADGGEQAPVGPTVAVYATGICSICNDIYFSIRGSRFVNLDDTKFKGHVFVFSVAQIIGSVIRKTIYRPH